MRDRWSIGYLLGAIFSFHGLSSWRSGRRILRLTRAELDTDPEVRFWVNESDGRDFYCRRCSGRNFVAEF